MKFGVTHRVPSVQTQNMVCWGQDIFGVDHPHIWGCIKITYLFCFVCFFNERLTEKSCIFLPCDNFVKFSFKNLPISCVCITIPDVLIILSLEPRHGGRPGQLSGHYAIKHPGGENIRQWEILGTRLGSWERLQEIVGCTRGRKLLQETIKSNPWLGVIDG